MADGANETGVEASGNEPVVSNSTQGEGAAAENQTTQAQTTLLNGDDGGDDDVRPQANWPDDWREKIAKGDEKVLKRLSRFSGPDNIFKSMLEAEKKLSSGAYKRALAEDATPEDIAAWRKENGLPEKAEDYKIDLAEGFVPSEADKPLLDEFKTLAFERNMSPKDASALAQWFLAKEGEVLAERIEADKKAKQEALASLAELYGPERRSNLQASNTLIQNIWGDMADDILLSRMPDGTIIGNNAEAVKRAVDYALDVLPEAKLMPAGSGDVRKGVDSEIESIEKRMREDFNGYMADEKLQTRYNQLLAARERRGQRAA